MTLVLKASGVIANPLPRSLLLPGLGVSGVLARYHSFTAAGAVGAPVTSLVDQTTNARNAPLLSGAATVAQRSGKRVIDLANGAVFQSAAFTTPIPRTVAMLAWVNALPDATVILAASSASDMQSIVTGTHGRFQAYVGGAVLQTAPLTPGWNCVIASFAGDGSGKIAKNGVITSGALGFFGNGLPSIIKIAGGGNAGIQLMDFALINHAVTDAEIASINAAMMSYTA